MSEAMDRIAEKRAAEAVLEARSETARALWNDGIRDFDKIVRITRLTHEQLREALADYIS